MIDEEFCDYLEYTLTRAFKHSERIEFNSLWCDGVVPPDLPEEELKAKLLIELEIVLDAFIGSNGQDRYKILLKVGQRAISKVNQSDELVSCIPEINESFWVIDIRKRIVTVTLY